MINHQSITTNQVKHIAQLANIPITETEEVSLSDAFNETLGVIDELKAVDVDGIEPTHQVTGLENVWREDKITSARMFSQKQALANAKHAYRGYFVVPRVIDEKDE